ncbi:U-box domain-containing protein [Xylariaceae sp. FL0255]|nr:U-box domain-containing protein [Xylariaceae sp. FL0255]
MTPDAQASLRLKENGNANFKAGKYEFAIADYTKGLIFDKSNTSLYTNRAHAYLKLQYYEKAIEDCDACRKIDDNNMKAWYLRAQCQLCLHQYEDALNDATRALTIGSETNDKSLPQLTALVLRCRTERWNKKEADRKRQYDDLKSEVFDAMNFYKQHKVNEESDQLGMTIVAEEWDQRAKLMEEVLEKARDASEKRREIPSWAIDDINFGIMVEPVVTKSGKSFEKASILESLKHRPIDPITREPMAPYELRPNLALKAACAEFLEENGWAADW